ncbi:MAG: DUF5658 family protein, partial [Planctomycetota bacterium]
MQMSSIPLTGAPQAAVPFAAKVGPAFPRFGFFAGRERRVVLLLAAIFIMSVLDLGLTIYMLSTVGMAEENPLARAVMQTGSPTLIALWKFATCIPAMYVLWRLRGHRAAELGSWAGTILLAVVMVKWNLYMGQSETIIACVDAFEAGVDARWVSPITTN